MARLDRYVGAQLAQCDFGVIACCDGLMNGGFTIRIETG